MLFRSLSSYNEDSDTEDDDIDTSPGVVASIDFDLDITEPDLPLSSPSTVSHPAVTATVLHHVEKDTTNHPAIGGQFDSGANMNTTNHLHLLWSLPTPKFTIDAGQNRHTTRYSGYLLLPCTRNGQANYVAIKTYYTPTIGVTLISRLQYPDLVSWNISDADNIASANFHDINGETSLVFPLYSNNNLHWTAPFVCPSIIQRRSALPTTFNLSLSISRSHSINVVDTPFDDLLIDEFVDFDNFHF